MTPQQIISQIVGWITQAVFVALLLLIGAAVAGKYGVRVPALPATDPQALAWLCLSFWALKGGKLF